jgi:hypothetical protein
MKVNNNVWESNNYNERQGSQGKRKSQKIRIEKKVKK